METLEDVLAHHGVKGMRWGFRKGDAPAGRSRAARVGPSNTAKTDRQVKRADKRFDRRARLGSDYIKVYNQAADKMNRTEITRINNKPEYKGVDMRKKGPVQDKYFKEYLDTFNKALDEASTSIIGTNASGTKRVEFKQEEDLAFPVMRVVDVKKVKHDDASTDLKVTWSEDGHILKIEMPDILAHGEEIVSDFLEHHGIKGMRWGFRKGDGGVTTARKKAPTSADFKKAEAARRKVGVKKTGPSAKKTAPLSNEELQALVKRMNLEKQFAELSTKDQTKVSGAHITGKILSELGKGVGQVTGNVVKSQATNLGNQLAKQQIEKLLKQHAKK